MASLSTVVASSIPEDAVPIRDLIWHTILRIDGTPTKVLGPKDLFDESTTGQSLDLNALQRPIIPRDLHNETTGNPGIRTLFPNTGLGPLIPSNITADITNAATYSPRRTFDSDNSYHLNPSSQRSSLSGAAGIQKFTHFNAGFSPSSSPWNNDGQQQSWGRQGFGSQTPRTYRSREQNLCSPWAGPFANASQPTSPIGPPPQPQPLGLSPVPTASTSQASNSANFEKWCRNRLLKAELNSLAATAEVTKSSIPLQPPGEMTKDELKPNIPILQQGKTNVIDERAIVPRLVNGGGTKVERDHVSSESNSEGEVGDGKTEGETKEPRGQFNRRCRYINLKGGCREGADCPYIHTPRSKRTQSPKKDLADSSNGTGPRAIITRGMSADDKKSDSSPGSTTRNSSPVSVDSPKHVFPPPNKTVTILQRPSASPSTSRIPTPPAQSRSNSPSVPATSHGGISADMTDLSRPKGVKEFCTYWIRTGKCDFFNQQGCAYSHDKDAYYAKYPLRPAPAPPLILRERGEEASRSLGASKWANKGLGEVKLTIITKAPLPSPLFAGKGASPTKKSWAAEKRQPLSPPPTTTVVPNATPKKGRVGTLSRKVVIRGATVNFANGGRWKKGDKLTGAPEDEETSLSSDDVDAPRTPPALSKSAVDIAKAGIDDASLSRPWNKVSKKALKNAKPFKGGRPAGRDFKEDDLLMPWIESQTKVGIESQTGMRVEVGDLLGMDDGSVAGSVLELKGRN